MQNNVILLQSSVELENNELPKLNYDPFIIIDEDSDFLAYPGDGNETHPYLIQGYDILRTLHPSGFPLNCCIIVANTTKHFIIQNNNINQGYSGIRIESVAPGTAKVINNDAYRNIYGIYMINVTGAVIEDNYVHETNFHAGIGLENCHDCNITNNVVSEIGINPLFYPNVLCAGIRIEGCTGINIINNDLSYCELEAINILFSNDILVQTNYIHDCDPVGPAFQAGGALALTSTSSTTIYNNLCKIIFKEEISILICVMTF